MSRSKRRRVGVGLTFLITGVAGAIPMAGCEGGGLGGLMGSRTAMDLLSPLVKDAAKSYLANLTSLTESLGDLKSLQGVLDLVQRAEPMVRQLSSSYDTLAATTGDERSNLIEAFGSEFASANKDFLGKATDVKGKAMWGQAISPLLDQVKLFQ